MFFWLLTTLVQAHTAIHLFSTTDLHGHLENANVLNGYVQIARAADPETLFVDSGDLFQGTLLGRLTLGSGVVRWMNAAGYTATAIGNHEFDFGTGGAGDDRLAVLKTLERQASFAFLGANICSLDEDPCVDARAYKPASFARAYVWREVRGYKIAVVGLTTPETATTTLPGNVDRLRFMPLAATLERLLPRLRAEGADAIVVLAHVGGACDPGCHGEVFDLLDALSADVRAALTLVLGGHSHNLVNTIHRGVPVAINGAYGKHFGYVSVDLADRRVNVEQVAVEGGRSLLGQDVTPSWPEVVTKDVRRASEIARRPVGRLLAPANAAPGGGTSALGDLMVDVLRACAHPACDEPVDVSFLNGGAVRVTGLPAGEITFGQLFELSPFEDRLASARLTGRQVRALLEHYQRRFGYFGLFAGLRIRAEGARLIDVRLDDGRPLEDDRRYRVNLTEFLATGGDGLRDSLGAVDFSLRDGRTLRDMLVDYFRTHPAGVTPVVNDGRLTR